MSLVSRLKGALSLSAFLLIAHPFRVWALDPHKPLTQYTRAVWTQADGLPQDTIQAITQTADGYLWLGTDDGLARFDGYDFIIFNKDNGSLPSNSIASLAAGRDGALWIGTPNGLVRYRDGVFRTFSTRDGLPANTILSLSEDQKGGLWIGTGFFLSRFEGGKFTNYPIEDLAPLRTVHAVYEDRHHNLLVAGRGGLIVRSGDRFVPLLSADETDGALGAITEDRNGDIWIAGGTLIQRTPDGKVRRFTSRDGLPNRLVRAVMEDRDGNIWTGTTQGLSRLEGRRFVTEGANGGFAGEWVRCIFEDREGNLWVGMTGGLYRFRDDFITIYGRAEGMPSDEPITVLQDRNGQVWVGFHNDGLASIGKGKPRLYTVRDGLLSNEIFSLRETRAGDLLVLTRAGVNRMHDGVLSNYIALRRPGPVSYVADMMEDRQGRIWVAAWGGLFQRTGPELRNPVVPSPAWGSSDDSFDALSEGPDGSIWAGTYGEGLWQIRNGERRHYTTADGLSSDRIHALYHDADGALWIGTFGGGLSEFRDGVFSRYTARDGLLGDNIGHIEDDGNGSLWLATTRGICRIAKGQLRDFAKGAIKRLSPTNYTTVDGLRSAQCAPGYAVGGGTVTRDGRLWFPTTRGLAVVDPGTNVKTPPETAPEVHLLSATVDGRELGLRGDARIKAGVDHLQFRYTGIHLTAPERVRYEYMLEGLDDDWTPAMDSRVTNYNSLRHGQYRFRVRAFVPGHPPSETSYAFEMLPHFYERQYFLWLCAASLAALVFGLYQLRLKQVRSRFSLVLAERAGIAREIHDTLAQGFVGISSQLDALSLKMKAQDDEAGHHLKLAQRMARHSLKEAGRSMMDLRSAALMDRDLPAALARAGRQWAVESSVPVDIRIRGTPRRLPAEIVQNSLRIAQEAVTNALKHAKAKSIAVVLELEQSGLLLSVTDDGRGFEPSGVAPAISGHYGLLGMRERAEHMGGELNLSTEPGRGTCVTVNVPLPAERPRREKAGISGPVGLLRNLMGLK